MDLSQLGKHVGYWLLKWEALFIVDIGELWITMTSWKAFNKSTKIMQVINWVI